MVTITFRRLVDADLPMLHGWLNDPTVVEWWEGDDVSWEAVVRDYGSAAVDSTEHWIASLEGAEIGWIQCYPAIDEPDETAPWFGLGIERTAAGIDYLIGDDPRLRGRCGVSAASPLDPGVCRSLCSERGVVASPQPCGLPLRRTHRGRRRTLPSHGP
jgi:hypothetical protein